MFPPEDLDAVEADVTKSPNHAGVGRTNVHGWKLTTLDMLCLGGDVDVHVVVVI